ncbi:MAG: hypothetical protein V4719_26570 [Planctomycetota bacterium]
MITLERRPFKQIEFIAAQGVTRPEAVRGNPGSFEAPKTKRDYKKLEYVNDEAPESAFITTRCYSPSGKELWNADHGADVYALDVDARGSVFQSGGILAGELGDSLFHKVTDGACPLVTKMTSGGEPLWAIKHNFGTSPISRGICCSPDGYVYYGINSSMIGTSDSLIRKIRADSGATVGVLPMSGFNYPLDGFDSDLSLVSMSPRITYQLRCNALGHVVANMNIFLVNTISGITTNRGYFPHKWVNDIEHNVFLPATWNISNLADFDLDDAGNCFAGYVTIWENLQSRIAVLFGPEFSTSPDLPRWSGTELAEVRYPDLDSDHRSSAPAVGCSPNGRVIYKQEDNETISTLVRTGDMEHPVLTPRVVVPGLYCGQDAIAINDSGVYAYNCGGTDPISTHEIRAADNSLILRANHGSNIHACVVLPNGKVIVAGKRVPK